MRKTNAKALQNNKGITLIGLMVVVAIIIVLLRFGIKYAIDSDLIGHAEKTAKATNERERDQLDQAETIMGRIDDIEKQQQINACGEHDFVDNKCSKCGLELVIGAPINYHEYLDTNGNAFSTMPSYTSLKTTRGSTNSSDSDATYSVVKNSGIEWIVLGGEGNQIKITTKNIVQPTSGGYTDSGFTYLKLEGQTGYTNFVNELNKIGAVYGQGKYSDKTKFTTSGGRSFKMEDLGYNALTRTATYKYALEKHSGDTEAKVYRYAANKTPDGTSTTGGTYSTFKYMALDASNSTQETESSHAWYELTADKPVITIYQYTYSVARILDRRVQTADTHYWLATRYLYVFDDHVRYHVGSANDGDLIECMMCSSYGRYDNSDSGVRPVVYLKSDIKLSYDETSGYTIKE